MSASPWRTKALEALAVVIGVAIAARVVLDLLTPLLPAVAVLFVVAGIVLLVLRRH